MDNRIEAARQKLTQLFNFFKAVEQRRAPIVRHMANQPWTLRLSELPAHETLRLFRPVPNDGPWLIFRKPETHPCPPPGDSLLPWLDSDWGNPDIFDINHHAQRVDFVGGVPNKISFESQPRLKDDFLSWREMRILWRNSELPASSLSDFSSILPVTRH